MGRNSNGKPGEQLALVWFAQHNWRMFRSQPPTRNIMIKGRFSTILCKSDGIPDYMGYELVQIGSQLIPVFRAVEVKEAHGDTMPCSRLGSLTDPTSQNSWMSGIDHRCCFIAIYWIDCRCLNVYKWKVKGSYKMMEHI